MTRSPPFALLWTCIAVLTLAGLSGCATVARPAAAGVVSAPVSAPAPSHELYIDCRGPRTDAPTIVLEAGAYGLAADWDLVMTDLAKTGRVCAYDRAGLGASPRRQGPPTVAAIANGLKGLLDRLGETRPVILVGHSNGALYSEAFARQWPDRVAGLVYVNGVDSDALDDARVMADVRSERRIADWAIMLGRIGATWPVAQKLVSDIGLSGDAAQRKIDAMTSIEHIRASRAEIRQIVRGLKATRALPPLHRDIPMAIVVGDTDPEGALPKAWHAVETAQAHKACEAWILDAPGATHTSPLGRDRAYVTAAVAWVESMAARPDLHPPGCAPTL
jgi:pimeloyl-ACP methyl ester carboxylesterase